MLGKILDLITPNRFAVLLKKKNRDGFTKAHHGLSIYVGSEFVSTRFTRSCGYVNEPGIPTICESEAVAKQL